MIGLFRSKAHPPRRPEPVDAARQVPCRARHAVPRALSTLRSRSRGICARPTRTWGLSRRLPRRGPERLPAVRAQACCVGSSALSARPATACARVQAADSDPRPEWLDRILVAESGGCGAARTAVLRLASRSSVGRGRQDARHDRVELTNCTLGSQRPPEGRTALTARCAGSAGARIARRSASARLEASKRLGQCCSPSAISDSAIR